MDIIVILFFSEFTVLNKINFMKNEMPALVPFALPEVSEAAAKGSLCEVYADIRQVMRLPMVNLIYRHLATQQATLERVWNALRPHFASGAVDTAAAQLRSEVESIVKAMEVAPRRSWSSPASFEPAILEVVEAYLLGNSQNLVALSALLLARGAPASADDNSSSAYATLPYPQPLRPMPDFRDLDDVTRARIYRLNRLADEPEPAVVASLYRHLALWPQSLAAAEDLLEELEQRNTLRNARDATVAAARELLMQQPLQLSALGDEFNRSFGRTLGHFATVTIPKMLPIGTALLLSWRAPPAIP
jgi:hypothetical protein